MKGSGFGYHFTSVIKRVLPSMTKKQIIIQDEIRRRLRIWHLLVLVRYYLSFEIKKFRIVNLQISFQHRATKLTYRTIQTT